MAQARTETAAPSSSAQISTRIVQLMLKYTGRGPTRARTTISDHLVVVVLEDALTRGELSLVAAGEGEAVARQRRLFGQVMRGDTARTIEEVTGRRVRSVMTDVDPGANLVACLFVLEELPEIGGARLNGDGAA